MVDASKDPLEMIWWGHNFSLPRAIFQETSTKMDLKNCDYFCKEQIENDFFLSTIEKTSECWKLWSEKTRLRLVVPLLVDNAEWRLGHRPIIFVGISLDLNVAYHVDSFAIIWFLNTREKETWRLIGFWMLQRSLSTSLVACQKFQMASLQIPLSYLYRDSKVAAQGLPPP